MSQKNVQEVIVVLWANEQEKKTLKERQRQTEEVKFFISVMPT